MRGRPCPQSEYPRTQVELLRILDQKGRWDESDLVDQFSAHDAAERVDVEWATARHRLRQVLVADKDRSVACKGGVSEYMVGVGMRIDDVADGLVGVAANGGEQLSSLAHAAAGVDDGDRIVANNEADIGNRALVFARHQRDRADMH